MKFSNFNTGPALFLIVYQTIFLTLFPIYLVYYPVSAGLVFSAVLLFFLSGLSITGGYHRFYSHRTFKASRIVEFFLLFFGSMAGQGSVLRWSYDHRMHHAHVDTDEDPYSISKGFWYAHFLWILEKQKPIDPKVVPDLLSNRLLIFQDRYIGTCMFASNALAFLFFGWLLNDYIGAFVIVLWARLFALHHCTWFINSLAHTWGDKPFSQEQSAVNNYIISFLTFGEGYHNYHHTFANDYRNGVRWYHFDPTKWMIWALSKVGLAYNLKTMDSVLINKRIVTEHKRLLLERLSDLWYVKRDAVESKINSLADQILEKLSRITELKHRCQEIQKQCNSHDVLKELRQDLAQLHRSIKQDLSHWTQLSRHIMRLKPLKV